VLSSSLRLSPDLTLSRLLLLLLTLVGVFSFVLTNKSRTGSVGLSQDRSRKLSRGKRTLDRSSSRRLSQGSVSHDTSINKPRNRTLSTCI
jgi:hypothetical protein